MKGGNTYVCHNTLTKQLCEESSNNIDIVECSHQLTVGEEIPRSSEEEPFVLGATASVELLT
ncbi:MAG: hypothetical protein US57_C0009G0019 [Candidatus Moranbacteria bacterium GW2011_GWC2_37_73]|nr:MAG: hypothetical protein UR95_C0005G0022 [Parcubacteria group bacterium GW2011_GWC1_36_108]KKQ00175.1 MAG: hypothetical protein US09_C0018G0005 [Candidatus Moranbacteria bacterium GW2011_GWD1_36_198]KKQ01308.1 MAG: hypothetical protein US10_C0018G0005 [Candidatus Moranbacteria bacterium GW2011_GWD2_36_198]KKQ39775.1 MAG: hypothetical protein US57_C0009G0019 [Candidatus Moranbacteria bacterium GW2011_GWC2_37_73]HAR99769.1 hypothetical protein [Candidatus Moranbacteria bacterium]